MSLEQLKEYLKIVTELEQASYLQNQLKNDLEKSIQNLGHAAIYDPPLPFKKTLKTPDFEDVFGKIIKGAILGFVLWPVSSAFLSTFWGIWLPLSAIVPFMICGILLLFLRAILIEAADIRKGKLDYQKRLAEYEEMVSADRIRIRKEKEKIAYLRQEIAKLDQIHNKTAYILQKAYDKDICFPKYRNLAAMCTIYEYISSGRCDKLTGEHGAYNLYEMESRLDRIITKLDDIAMLLHKIKEQQYMLYHAIQESTQKKQEMVAAINRCADRLDTMSEQIERQSIISQYQFERATKELEYMNRMNLISGNYSRS